MIQEKDFFGGLEEETGEREYMCVEIKVGDCVGGGVTYVHSFSRYKSESNSNGD